MKVYIVCVQNAVSQEAYLDYNKAKSFIENRSDKPVMINPFKFKSNTNEYNIYEVSIQKNKIIQKNS